MERIKEGLEILLKYNCKDKDFSAEHDQVWAGGPEPSELSAEDSAALDGLGWFWDEEFECWSHFA